MLPTPGDCARGISAHPVSLLVDVVLLCRDCACAVQREDLVSRAEPDRARFVAIERAAAILAAHRMHAARPHSIGRVGDARDPWFDRCIPSE